VQALLMPTKRIEGLPPKIAGDRIGLSEQAIRLACVRGELKHTVVQIGRQTRYLIQERHLEEFRREREEQLAAGKRAGHPSRGDRERRQAGDA
jgi:5-bromo-4-chloroindolyl phosphate hydrolysis protein